jgi:hypothetical protein
MSWMTIRIELARTPAFPEGSPSHAYMLHLPLNEAGLIDVDAWAKDKTRATVRRLWPGEPDQFGQVVRTRGGGWAFSYAPGSDDDESLFHLADHRLQVGDYMSVTEVDGDRLPFKVVSCHP